MKRMRIQSTVPPKISSSEDSNTEGRGQHTAAQDRAQDRGTGDSRGV